MIRTFQTFLSVAVLAMAAETLAEWKPAEGPLMTRWSKEVSPENVHAEYPRPQLVRDKWENLNGLWDYAILPKDQERPESFDGKILVPFPVESALSGVMKAVKPNQRLWYRRHIRIPDDWKGQRIMLNFGAVDWHAEVWVNGHRVGEHKGGYDPFSFDITEHLATIKSSHDILTVAVWDPTDASYQPRGKQVLKPGSIWYTAVTGIWQTVWLEPVAPQHIGAVAITPDVDAGTVHLKIDVGGAGGELEASASVSVDGKDKVVGVAAVKPGRSGELSLPIADARLWSPDDPHLYDLRIQLKSAADGKVVDTVDSYFGMRKIHIAKDGNGMNRIFLNNKELFHFGPLDQGWWPDGLYTAPTDDALRYDIEMTKKLGMNMCRKHVKIEPARWYYWCDKLGLMVWQDMPSGDKYIKPNEADYVRSPESADNYRRELNAMIDTFYNSPSVVAWVPFNEGWGQFDTDKVLALTKQRDPSRLVDGPSGWADRGSGDMHDIHRYPGPGMPLLEDKRAAVLGEFGGLGWPVEGHLWWNKRNWGYRTYHSQAELEQNYDVLMRKLRQMIRQGLAAAIYTQTTDVEGEVNGLMTYDRARIKFDVSRIAKMHETLFEPLPVVFKKLVVPTSEQEPQLWRYTTFKPADAWATNDFDDSQWEKGMGGFGEVGVPGSVARTKWKTSDIWARRTFNLETTDFQKLQLRVYHDEDAEVYINGKQVASLPGYQTGYMEIPLNEEGLKALKAGENLLAVHCRQTDGGQYIDVGLINLIQKAKK